MEQPMPDKGDEAVTPHLREMFNQTLNAQIEKGLQKYGTVLKTFNGRDAGEDAFQEWIDLGQYLTQLRMEHSILKNKLKRIEWVIENSVEQAVDSSLVDLILCVIKE